MAGTRLYWLIDTRPDTIASGYPNGRPVIAGTSSHRDAEGVLSQLQRAKARGARWESIKVLESLCGHFRIDVIDVEANTLHSARLLTAFFPPNPTWTSRRMRYEDKLTPDEIGIIERYVSLKSGNS